MLELLEVLWPVIAVVLGVIVLIALGPYLIGGLLAFILIPIKAAFRKIFAIPAFIKLTRRFDEGLEQELARYLPKNAMEIEFHIEYIGIRAYNGNWYVLLYSELGYDFLPNIRYTFAMAKLVNDRILKNNNFYIEEMYSKSEGGLVSDGYHTTKSSDGYHTKEEFTYIPSETNTYGYKLVNMDYRKKLPKKPTIKKW